MDDAMTSDAVKERRAHRHVAYYVVACAHIAIAIAVAVCATTASYQQISNH